MPTNTPRTTPITPRGARMYLDDGSEDPVRLRVRGLTMSITNGGHAIIHARDEDGEMIGAPRKGAQAGVSTIQFTCKLHQAGDDASTAYFVDYLTRSDEYDNLTSVDTDTTDWKICDFALEIPDNGTVKGATYALGKVLAQPGWSLTKTEDGYELNATFESPDPYVSVTVNP